MPTDTLLRPLGRGRAASVASRADDVNRTPRMITRIWHGWTTVENADGCEQLLRSELLESLSRPEASGCIAAELLRRDLGPGEIEFVTIMQFPTWEAVKRFAGEECERAVVSEGARRLLARYYEVARHYEAR